MSVRALNQLNLKTSRVWTIKKNSTQFWSYRYKGAAKRFFDAWASNAMRSCPESVNKVVKMLRRYEAGLLNLSQHRISNAYAEGFNSAIQLIKARPTPASLATSPTTGQGFCSIAASWVWVGRETKITVQLTKRHFYFHFAKFRSPLDDRLCGAKWIALAKRQPSSTPKIAA